MNRVVVSLLKGSNKDKLTLLNEGLTYNNLLKLCNSNALTDDFSLTKGYGFNRLNAILELIEHGGVETITMDQDHYPSHLRDTYDPPFMLYVRGDKTALARDIVSVVGTRKPSLRGYHEAFRLGLDLGREQVGVVSGLALGIDSASHSGNIETGGRTIAVLGCGIDQIYPTSNKTLAGKIIEHGGAIISEFPPGEEPKRFNFPKRNRVIAGLSRQLIIVQAPKKSGALITGDYALNNGGDIFVHSVGVNDIRFLGSDRYVKDGAVKIDSAMPVLKQFNKGFNIEPFDSSQYKSGELIKLELSGEILKYKGCYFRR